tara:strand:+ start:158 stop:487 length:330 start_codon:yes stop_codon:yes gene_type:complete
MKRIKWICDTDRQEIKIRFGKIRPFQNICKVTGRLEHMNAEIEYIPNKYLLEIGSYRERLDEGFDDYVEGVGKTIFDEIDSLIKPKALKVIVYLEDKYLSPWNVEITKC